MNKALSRTLTLIGGFISIIGFILVLIEIHAFDDPQRNMVIGTLAIVGFALTFIGCIILTIAWAGALVRAAQLAQWGWFVCLLLFGYIPLFIYIFVGPTTQVSSIMKQPEENFSTKWDR